jgi:hypothetical protein
MGFDLGNCPLKIQESIGTQTPKWEFIWDVRVHSHTLFCTFGSMRCDSRASLLARNLASPCFGRKLKVRVVTKCRNLSIWLAIKARGLQGCGPISRPGSHITCSRECKECEGVNPHTPK